MSRERIVKDTPKRGKLTENQVKRAVEKVVLGKDSDGNTIPSGEYRKTRLCLGVPGVELQNPDMLQAFVEIGLLLPDVPLDNHSLELRLWVPWPADRKDFSLYKINPETGRAYAGASDFMMEVRHTDSYFSPQLPDAVWEDAPRVAWQTLSEQVEDYIKIIIRTQHLRQRNWPLLPEGDPHWVDYFNEFLEYFEFEKQKTTTLDPEHILLVCVGHLSSPVEMLRQCLDKNLDPNSNLPAITMVIEDCVDFEGEEFRELTANFVAPIKLDIKPVSIDLITNILKSFRSTYIDDFVDVRSIDLKLPADALSSTQHDSAPPLEKWEGFTQIGFDLGFSEDDSRIFIDRRLLLDTTDIGDDIHETIFNTIETLEKRRGLDNIENKKLDRQKEVLEEL